jgi:NTE family protein
MTGRDPAFPGQLTGMPGRVEVVSPDEASAAAFGTDVLDPATRTPAARSGRVQGHREAARIAARWD